MIGTAQHIVSRGVSLALNVAGTGLGLVRAGAGEILERTFGDGRSERRPAGREGVPGGAPAGPSDATPAPMGEPGRVPTPPARPDVEPTPPTAAEAVEAEQAEARAWRPGDVEGTPSDPRLEHVEEEATLVGESSDVGAEEGAGPEISVSEPWHGYDRMRARDVVDRLQGAGPDVAAAVRLYESTTRGRKTIIEATERVAGS